MNILIVTQYFYPEAFRINELAISLVKKGHKVTVLTGTPNYPQGFFYKGYGWFKKTFENYQGVEVLRVPVLPRGQGRGLRLALNYFSYVFFGCLLGPLRLRGKKIDTIFVFQPSPVTVGIPAVLIKKWKRSRLLFWVQDLWPETLSATGVIHSKKILGWIGCLVKYLYRHSSLVLVQSEAFISSILKMGIPLEKIRYFPNSAEELYQVVEVLDSSPVRSLMPVGFRVMFAGNIGVAQDFPTVLDAAEILKNTQVKWIVLGDGSMKKWVEEEIKRRKLSESFYLLGRHPLEKMPEFFACADVLLAALKQDPIFELTIPSKIQSYLACGKPTMAAMDGEGARIIQESGSGWTCRSEDANSLAAAVLKASECTPETRKAMGESGRKYFEKHFELKFLLNRLEEWL